MKEGQWQGGVKELGLKENGVGYVYDDHNRALIPPAVHDKIERIRQKIVAGEIQVPRE